VDDLRPTIHMTNFSSRTLHRGRVFSIMAKPRRWEHGEGFIRELVPAVHDLEAVQSGRIDLETYRARFLAGVPRDALSPPHPVLRDGDTLCCSCSREEALAGRCHRVWSARLLVEAGWRVILDGLELVVTHG
jgi:hypothetical protein